MPRKGTPCSRAYRMAAIIPSVPRSPKPPGTSTPAQPESTWAAFVSVTSSESTHRMSTTASLAVPAWFKDSTTER